MFAWQDLGTAVALLLIAEGIIPFLNPAGLRRVLLTLAQLDDRTLRNGGLVSMIVGVVVLYLIRS